MPNKKIPSAEVPKEGKLIGKISHYFGNIGVAIIELSGTLKIKDTIRVLGGETDFTQTVESMEVEHKKMEQVKKGESVGIKLDEKVREGYKVYKI